MNLGSDDIIMIKTGPVHGFWLYKSWNLNFVNTLLFLRSINLLVQTRWRNEITQSLIKKKLLVSVKKTNNVKMTQHISRQNVSSCTFLDRTDSEGVVVSCFVKQNKVTCLWKVCSSFHTFKSAMQQSYSHIMTSKFQIDSHLMFNPSTNSINLV